MLSEGKVGLRTLGDGAQAELRMERTGSLVTTDGHGRFYEANYRNQLYRGGIGLTAFTANNTATTLAATSTPVIGLWNPATSSVNLVVLQANLVIVPNNLTSGAGPGIFNWLMTTGQTSISTGSNPVNCRTLTATGSQAKFFPMNVALTGLITTTTLLTEAAPFQTPNGMTYTTLGSVAPMPSYASTQNIDGSIILPPGGLLMLQGTTTATTWSGASSILWEELPI